MRPNNRHSLVFLLFITVFSAFVFVATAAVLMIRLLSITEAEIESVIMVEQQIVDAAHELETNSIGITLAATTFLYRADAASMARLNEDVDDFQRFQKSLDKLLTDRAMRLTFERIGTEFNGLKETAFKLVEIRQRRAGGNRPGALIDAEEGRLHAALLDHRDRIDMLLDIDLQPAASRQLLKASKHIETSLETLAFFVGIALTLALLILIYAAIVLKRRLGAPVQELLAVFSKVTTGDLLARSTHEASDEIGQLATAVNQTLTALSEQVFLRTTLASLLDRMTDAVVIARRDGTIEFINRAGNALLREPRCDKYALPLATVLPELEPDVLLRASETRSGITSMRSTVVTTHQERIPVILEVVQMDNHSLGGLILCIQDLRPEVEHSVELTRLSGILEQHRARLGVEQRERRRLETELIDLSEREQARIGHELHDGMGQTLSGIAFLSKALQLRLREQGSAQADNAGWIVKLVNEAVEQVRFLARSLSPVALDAPDLYGALKHLSEDVKQIFGVTITLDLPEQPILMAADHANHLFRISQEAVNNAIRHGHAQNIRISIKSGRGNVRFAVSDDGSGMSKPVIGARYGIGMQSMHVRAQLFNARLLVRSSSRGTVIIVSNRRNPAANQTANRVQERREP